MAMFLITLTFMIIVSLLLGVGILMGRKPLAGSCGGVGKALQEPNYECPMCGGDESKCESRAESVDDNIESSLIYDATKNKE